MRVIFMGTPMFATKTLCELIKFGHDVVGVFTKEDKPFGRKRILKFSEVKEKALEFGLKVFQPKKFGQDEVELIKSLKADVIVVVAFGKILPREVLYAPKHNSLNLHASLLPKYRGASPIQTSIINCEEETGVSIVEMTEKLDSGRVLKQVKTKIDVNETAEQLEKRLSFLGAKAMCDVLKSIEDNKEIVGFLQDEFSASYASKITKDMGRIDFEKSCLAVHKLICGLSKWPIAYCYFCDKLLKIYKSEVCEGYSGQPGEVLDSKSFVVGCKTGAVRFLEVKLEGGKKLLAKDFLNGHFVKKGLILG